MTPSRAPRRRLVVRLQKNHVQSLERRLFRICAQPEPPDVDVDLARVAGLGPEAVAVLVHARFALHQRGSRLRIERWHRDAHRLLDACGLFGPLDAVRLDPKAVA